MESPDLEWHGGLPASRRFGDVYSSRDGGAGEARHVFLEGNRLAARFSALSERPSFVSVGELGFGTGLNFLLARELFRNAAPKNARLCYVSCERYPMAPQELSRFFAGAHCEGVDGRALLERYPTPLPGFSRAVFDGGRVSLTLFFGDVLDFFQELHAGRGFDAWFLDGFSPLRNPEMWSEKVFREVAGASRPGATLATFSAAGSVRRGLAAAGFVPERRPGFGRKREMLAALFPGGGASAQGGVPDTVGIIGGGLAGCLAAEAFARRGASVVVEEPGFGDPNRNWNPAILTHPQFFAARVHGAGFTFQGLAYLSTLLCAHPILRGSITSRGSLRLLPQQSDRERIGAAIALNEIPAPVVRIVRAEEATELAGVCLEGEAAWVPDAVAVRPENFGASLLGLHAHCEVGGPGLTSAWQSDLVVVAAGAATAGVLEGFAGPPVPLNALAGQVALLPAAFLQRTLRTAVCFDGYALPLPEGLVLGSTYERISPCPPPREEVSAELMTRFLRQLPQAEVITQPIPSAHLLGWTGERCTTPDRLPAAGRFALLTGEEGARTLMLLSGFGSRGLITAPLVAETLAALAFGEPLPIGRTTLAALDPGRFARRAAARSAR